MSSINITSSQSVGVVLVVEDNPIIALDIEDILHGMGAERVIICQTCADALRTLEFVDIHFALLDVHLHDETSFDVAKALQHAGKTFMFVSASSPYGEVIFGIKDVEYLPKPFSAAQLTAALARMVSTAELVAA